MRETFLRSQNTKGKDKRKRKKTDEYPKEIYFSFKYLMEKRTEGRNSIGSESFFFFKSFAIKVNASIQKLLIVYLNSIVKIKEK